MSAIVLILRPEPGASATAARAVALGLEPRMAPLFRVHALDWEAPDPAGFDAVLLTSANAARHGGEALSRFVHLRCYAVGAATAEWAREAGFTDVRSGPADGSAVAAIMAGDDVRHVLHLCGRDRTEVAIPGASVERRAVYAADEVDALPGAASSAIAAGALVLVHSPRAAASIARLIPDRGGIMLAAISDAAAEAAGEGWRSKAVAEAPRDEALLELAAKLCQIASPDPGSGA